jgi:hypothetical protein
MRILSCQINKQNQPDEILERQADSVCSSPIVSVAVILVATLSRFLHLVFFYNLRVDASYQVMATRNLIEGHGVSLDYVQPSDLAQTIYEPLINWPPGYSFLLAPFLKIFNGNYPAAAILLDCIMALLLILFSRKILRLFAVPVYLINFFTLLTGFFIYYFYFIASSDALAISFFVVAAYFFIKLIKEERLSFWGHAVFFLSLLACASLKYMLIPVVFVLPVYLLTGWPAKGSTVYKAGVINFVLLCLGIGGLLFYQNYISGSVGYISQEERGFFPEHLKDVYPFMPSSIIKHDTAALLFSLPEAGLYTFYQFLHVAGFIIISFSLSKKLWDQKWDTGGGAIHLYIATWVVALNITLLLAFLSVRVAKEEILPGQFWTYIEEPRYHGLIVVLLQLCLFILLTNSIIKKIRWRTIALALLILLMVPEALRGMYFTFNRLRWLGKEEYSWQHELKIQQHADRLLQQEKRPQETAVVTGSWYYINHRVNLGSRIPILREASAINDPAALQTSKPAVVLVILRPEEMPAFQPFLQRADKKDLGSFRNFHFYSLHVGN